MINIIYAKYSKERKDLYTDDYAEKYIEKTKSKFKKSDSFFNRFKEINDKKDNSICLGIITLVSFFVNIFISSNPSLPDICFYIFILLSIFLNIYYLVNKFLNGKFFAKEKNRKYHTIKPLSLYYLL